MAQDPASDLKRSVDEHFDAAVGTHVRLVKGASDIGGRILDAGERAVGKFKAWWGDDGKGKRRTTDIRLPNEGRKAKRSNGRASGRR